MLVVVGVITLALGLKIMLWSLDLTSWTEGLALRQVVIAMMVRKIVWNALLIAAGLATLTGVIGSVIINCHILYPLAKIGIGVPADALPYLFERFYRVDRSRARRSGGSGIGLTIARQLAWAMAGDLTAESDGIGQGSTFRFTLPLADS